MKEQKSIPVNKVARASRFAVTGLKVGGNYLKHAGKKIINSETSQEDLDKENAKDIYDCLKTLKGSALKVAQILSSDSNVLPSAYTQEFSQAHYQAPPLSAPLIQKIIKREFKKDSSELYDSFEAKAHRAASIGQVHRAEYQGQKLAVKIQYPGVADSISSDLKLVKPMALRLFQLKEKDLKVFFKELESKMIEETDYLNELAQGEFMHEACKAIENLSTVRYIKDLSSSKVLTMEWVEGKHLDQFFNEQMDQELRNKIGQTLWDFYDYQMHTLKFLHADPHPGNFLVKEDGHVNVIDFGCMKKVPEKFYHGYFTLIDPETLADKKKFQKVMLETDILKPEDDKRTKEFFTEQFHRLLSFGMQPFFKDEFDFADKDFFTKLHEIGDSIQAEQKKNKLDGGRGSKHFLFVNRSYFGLFNLLHSLGVKIKTGNSYK